jgi:nucleoside-diphosphate-sugar epimerase
VNNTLLTGSSGFVGKSYIIHNTLNNNIITPTRVELYAKNLFDDVNAIIHLAGLAHNLKNSNLDYESINTQLTKNLFDRFLTSECNVFIYMSSILALKASSKIPLTEEITPLPETPYAKSKHDAEVYLLSQNIPYNKRVYIIRTPLVYGEGQKGNLPQLLNYIDRFTFWPFGSYISNRSFCDVRNLIFVIDKLIQNDSIESGIYHVADDNQLNLTTLYINISKMLNHKILILNIPKFLIRSASFIATIFHLPFNNEQLSRLTNSLLVSNRKIKTAIGVDLPYGKENDLLKTLKQHKN